MPASSRPSVTIPIVVGDLTDVGERVPLPGNRRRLLHQAGDLWMLESGRVDVFVVGVEDGAPRGARQHLVTLLPGDGVPALPPIGDCPQSLLAVAAESSQLVRVATTSLFEEGALAVSAIDRVLVTVLHAIASRHSRQFDVAADPAATLTVRAGQKLGRRTTPVWIVDGSVARFQGCTTLAGETRRPLPLASGAWCEVTADADVALIDTARLMDAGRLAEGWDAFSTLLSEYLRQDVAAQAGRERGRLAARAVEDLRARSAFLRSLLDIVVPGAQAGGATGADDALLEACQTVGRAAGITFRRPPAWERSRGISDPLGAICGASRVRYRQVALRGTWWTRDVGPLLCFRGVDKLPVAVLPGRHGAYEVVDPRTGACTPVDVSVRNDLDAFGYMFYRSLPDAPLGLTDLVTFGFRGLSWSFWSIALLATMSGVLGLFVPIATGFVYSTVIPSAHPGQLLQLFLGLVTALIAAMAFELTRGFVVLRIEAKGGTTMQSALFDRLLKLPPRFFRRFSVGDLVSRVGGVGQVQTLLSGTAVTAILGGLTASFNLALLFRYDWRLAFVGILWAGVAMLVVAACGWFAIRVQSEVQDHAGRLQGFVLQLISGITKIRLAGAEDRALAQWGRRYAAKVRLERQAARLQAGVTIFTDVLPLATSIVLFAGVGALVSGGGGLIDTASFIAFNAALGTFMAAAIATSNTLINLVQVAPLVKRALPILVEEPEVRVGKPDPGELTGRIEGKHLNFRYRPDGPLILDDVSFEADPGDFVAFVGPSGSGKSTSLRLLLGFEEPESGGVYFDGQDLASVDVAAVRRQMGVVLQSSRLMAGSIFTNIVGAAPLTIDDAWEAAELAGLADDIRTFPMGLHTVMSEGGGTLSGGQKQRLLIARALATKPRIILFDEATSALDNRTQRLVSESLARMHATRIVIAHRLSTIRDARRIYVMVKGRVVEVGDYDELMHADGVFARLAARQLA